eukprot:gene21954-28424_t
MSSDKYILTIDQGTSSTRCILFNKQNHILSSYQLEHQQIYPQSGWVEHDPMEILSNVFTCINEVCKYFDSHDNNYNLDHYIGAIGITNQRETTIVWNKETGLPYYNAIVWNDTRTSGICDEIAGTNIKKYQSTTGLPIATYFSASKLIYLLANIPNLRDEAVGGNALFGTIDSFLLYHLTNLTIHATDVTNASRTLLMNLSYLNWDSRILKELDIPSAMLPKIYPSSHLFGYVKNNNINRLNGVPISGILGDQQAALFGHRCFETGQSKCTYGTGAFILVNTGPEIHYSQHGLLSTVAFQLSSDVPAVYALEGSIAYAGSTMQWLRDN